MGSQAYTSTKPDTHGAPRDSPLGPLSAGGAPPARGPPSIGGIRPIIDTPTIVAWWIKVCHSTDTPTYYSRTLSYYMWAHIPSGTSCRTSSNHQRSSSIPPSRLFLWLTCWSSTNIISLMPLSYSQLFSQ